MYHNNPPQPLNKAVAFNVAMEILGSFHPVSAKLSLAFKENIFEKHLSKNDILVQQGSQCEHIYFLIKGVMSGYRQVGSRGLTTFISIDGDFVSSIGGLYGRYPADDNIIAQEDCYLLGLKMSTMEQFFQDYPELNIIMRKILELYYYIAHERAILIRMGSAEEKYLYFLKSLAGRSDRISTEVVASFLDLKISTLEKVKREISQKHKEAEIDMLLAQALETTMKHAELFRQKRLTSAELAKYLNVSIHQLSQLLNRHYQQSFSDFINAYRVDYVKMQLEHKRNMALLTIEAIGESAGFSSKSTFFAAFKKTTGSSPLNYSREK